MKHRPLNDIADEIVMILNEEIYADSDGELAKFIEEGAPLDYMSDGNIVIIRFFEVPIWDSDNDTRDMDENGEYTTDLQTHIRRLIRHHIKMISQIDIGGPL